MAQSLQAEDSGGQENLLNPDRVKYAVFILFFIGLFILAAGIGSVLFRGAQKQELEIITSPTVSPSSKIVVDVGGAVVQPGVYELTVEARIKDAVNAAGGLTQDADSTRINLASKITDGQKVYIAKVGEVQGVATGVAGDVSGLININTATAVELDKLPGIGPVTADKIISLRPYATLEDLLNKKAVSASVFEKIKTQVTY